MDRHGAAPVGAWPLKRCFLPVVFSSPLFLFVFLPVVFLAYFASGDRWRNAVLLVASLLFYTVSAGGYVLLLFFSIGANYALGRQMERCEDKRRRLVVLTAVAANMIPLFVFKYSGFAALSANSVLGHLGFTNAIPVPAWFLPAGISFFTFQGLAYVIDVYRKETPPCASLSEFALFKSFFPQLVAGPIVRYHNLSGELKSRRHSTILVQEGLVRFGFGLSKKILLADNLGRVADSVFGSPSASLDPSTAWVGIVCYTLQIFFDFSGYSDMAIGLGRVFGLSLPENFNQPYRSASITEFWRRWHMTLSGWFRDYVYFPLGGNRKGAMRTGANLLIVFFLCGLWHGASCTFVIWGFFHGLLLLIERTLKTAFGIQPRGLPGRVLTMVLVMIGWVFFRAHSPGTALEYLKHLGGVAAAQPGLFGPMHYLTANNVTYLVIGTLVALWPERRPATEEQSGIWPAIRPAAAVIVTLLAIVGQAPQSFNPFIYFQF
jgi:alginate O-acetyltransferase complex protein AlgI